MVSELKAEYVSEDVRRLNPSVFGEAPDAQAPAGLTPEERFLALWRVFTGVELQREFVFYPGRKWRADFAHIETRILIEIDGGTWIYGRHNRPAGYAEDCAKLNGAAEYGYRVFRLTPDMITADNVQTIVRCVQTGGGW